MSSKKKTSPKKPVPAKKAAKKAVAKKPKASVAKSSALPEFTILPENEVLVLRTCTKLPDGRLVGYGGFPWPKEGAVHAPEQWDPAWGEKPSDYLGGFDPKVGCGAGLHGIAGLNDELGLLDWSLDAQAMIVATDKTKMVQVAGKVKFASGIVTRLVSLAEGVCSIFANKSKIVEQVESITAEAKQGNDQAASGSYSKQAASGYSSKQAASGYSSKQAASGYSSKQAASGDSSKQAASGDSSKQAASGSYSKQAASGDSSTQAASGYSSTQAASGYSSKQAASGSYSKQAASGDSSKQAASGDSSKQAASGSYSKQAASGSYSKQAASGSNCVSMAAGPNGKVKSGPNGAFALAWHDGNRPRIAVGYVGEGGIEADTWYQVGTEGKIEAV